MSDNLNSTHNSAGASIEQALFNEKLRYLPYDKETLIVTQSTKVVDVLKMMMESRSGGLLVLDQAKKNLVGIFTERDHLDKLAASSVNAAVSNKAEQNLNEITIEELMTPQPRTLSPDNTVGEAVLLMTGGGYRHVPLLNSDGSVFGMVSVRDIVNYISEYFPEEVYNHPPGIHQQINTQEGG